MNRKALVLGIVALALGIQTLAAVHAPGVHEDPVGACAEGATHFCAEPVSHDTGPCHLCQISAAGIADLRPETLFLELGNAPVGSAPDAPATVPARRSPDSPRAPPVG